MQVMCQSCAEIDKRVEQRLELLRSTTDPAEIERIKRLISELYADRVRLHQNPDSRPPQLGSVLIPKPFVLLALFDLSP